MDLDKGYNFEPDDEAALAGKTCWYCRAKAQTRCIHCGMFMCKDNGCSANHTEHQWE